MLNLRLSSWVLFFSGKPIFKLAFKKEGFLANFIWPYFLRGLRFHGLPARPSSGCQRPFLLEVNAIFKPTTCLFGLARAGWVAERRKRNALLDVAASHQLTCAMIPTIMTLCALTSPVW